MLGREERPARHGSKGKALRRARDREKQKVSAAKRRARAPSEIRPGAGRRQGRSLDWARQGRAPWHRRDPSRGRTWAAVGRADRERREQRNAQGGRSLEERRWVGNARTEQEEPCGPVLELGGWRR
uniref:Uncharacterized protein n=1 Tax=Zea mays TaxID=4577 RepID=A0A804R1X5_MAIZE